VAAYSSPTTTPTMARPTPRRSPVSMKGTALGRMMVRNRRPSAALKLRATRSSLASVVRTPARALRQRGTTAPRKTINTLDQIPIPTQMMMSGRSATRGVAFRADRNGSMAKQNLRYHPAARPAGIPTAMASTNPRRNSRPLTRRSFQISPAEKRRIAVRAMAVGEDRKMGLMRHRAAALPSTGPSRSAHHPRVRPSQKHRKKTTVMVPRMARSLSR